LVGDAMFNKKKNVETKISEAFLSVYINKNKLLDVNSILFNGYSLFRAT